MLLFYSCNATVIIAGWWVTRAGTCACACLQVLGAVPQTLNFCEKCHWVPHGTSVAFGPQKDSDS